jgi:phage-related protein
LATTLRFILLGDDRASQAFDRFARSVDTSNRNLDRNAATMRQHSAASAAAQGGILGLTHTIAGSDHAMTLASSRAGMFAKALAGVNLATGLLEPVLAGVVVAAGGLAAASVAAGAGMGAYGLALKPVMTQVSALMKLQDQAAKGSKASQAQLTAMLKATPPAVVGFAASVRQAHTAYTQWGDSLARPVLAPLSAGLRLVQPFLRAISPLVRAAAGAFGILVRELGARITGGGLDRVVSVLLPHVQPVILNLAHAVGNLVAGIWGIARAFLPVSGQITGGVTRLTARFKEWANSLPSHTGFQSLMTMFREQTPAATAVLHNLAVIIANVARAMAGMLTPSNSTLLLNLLRPLTGIMAQLSANQGLVRVVFYFLMMRSALNQLTPAVKGVATGWDMLNKGITGARDAYSVVGRFAGGFRDADVAASAFSGTAGTLGGRLRTVAGAVGSGTVNLTRSAAAWLVATARVIAHGVAVAAVAVATKVWAAVQWLLNAALSANPIGLIVIALAALAAGIYLAWTHSATFRKIVIAVWRDVWGAIKAACAWIVGAAKTVWDAFVTAFRWVQRNWPLLLAILTGPIGLAALAIVRNWSTIQHWAGVAISAIHDAWSTVCNQVTRLWDAAVGLVKGAVSGLWLAISGVYSAIIHGAAAAFGWIPGIGGHLKDAARAFDAFRDRVNNAILGIKGRTVPVNVTMTSTAGVGPYAGKPRAYGGLIRGPGGPRDDRAGLFYLSNQEYVVQAAAVAKYGVAFMDAVNAGRMATGGLVGGGVTVRPYAPDQAQIMKDLTAALKNVATAWAKGYVGPGYAGGGSGGVVGYASSFAGRVPYVWGGNDPSGWDCSGFARWVYNHFGYAGRAGGMPRTSQAQFLWVQPTPGPVPGGLGFYAGGDGTRYYPGHVGIIVGPNRMVDAYGTGYGTRFDSIWGSSGDVAGFGIPPGGFSQGGRIPEPILGLGLRSGRPYTFGETGSEYVAGQADMKALLHEFRALRGEVAALAGEVRKVGPRTGLAVSDALNGAARSAITRAR